MQRGSGNYQGVHFGAAQVPGMERYGAVQATSLGPLVNSETGSYGRRPPAVAPKKDFLQLPPTFLKKVQSIGPKPSDIQPVRTAQPQYGGTNVPVLAVADPGNVGTPEAPVLQWDYSNAGCAGTGIVPPRVQETPTVVPAPTPQGGASPIAMAPEQQACNCCDACAQGAACPRLAGLGSMGFLDAILPKTPEDWGKVALGAAAFALARRFFR